MEVINLKSTAGLLNRDFGSRRDLDLFKEVLCTPLLNIEITVDGVAPNKTTNF